MTSDSLPCDVVLLPNEPLTQKALSASKDISKQHEVFSILDNINTFAHASLYMTQLSAPSIEKTKILLEKIASSYMPLELDAIGYGGDMGYSDVEFPRKPFADIQMAVIEAINPIRDGMRAKDEARMEEASGLKYDNFKEYGYPYVGELLRPHITFTRLTSGESPDTGSILGESMQFSGVFDRIGLFEMGDNGTCIRKLGEWKLG